jgi:hypothetical protein
LFFSLSQHKFHVYASLSICFVALMDLPFFFLLFPCVTLLNDLMKHRKRTCKEHVVCDYRSFVPCLVSFAEVEEENFS